MTYIKGILILQVVLVLLLHLAPGERYGKYIRFFAELVMMVGLLTPVCEWIYGNENFMEKIAYESFAESMSELSRDIEKMEFGQCDEFHEKYEKAISEEVRLTTEKFAGEHGLGVFTAEVSLSEDYKMEGMEIVLTDDKIGKITVGQVEIENETDNGMADGRCRALLTELADFYGIDEECICIEYYGTH